jgi:hypothetical protein
MQKLSDDQRFNLTSVDVWNCANAFEFVCPRYWESLSEGADPNIRFCSVCNQQVYRCETPLEFVSNAELGHCVAVPADRTPHHGFQKRVLGRPTKEHLDEMRQLFHDTRRWWQEIVEMQPQFASTAISEIARLFALRS